jgi:hypothetical protein
MKDYLMAPIEHIKPLGKFKKRISGLDMDTKFKGNMSHGTPNIRAPKKLKGMNQNQLQSRIKLQEFCGVSMAGGKSNDNEERDSNNFVKVSARKFFERTRDAEIELKSKHDIII